MAIAETNCRFLFCLSKIFLWIGLVVFLLLAIPNPLLASAFTPLGDLPGGSIGSVATGISADGYTVVGQSQSVADGGEAFRWTAVEGMVALGDIEGGNFTSVAYDVSADGSVIVGYGTTYYTSGIITYNGIFPFRWTEETGMVNLAPDPTSTGAATGVNADGSVVVGGHGRWTAATGWQYGPRSAASISADGTVAATSRGIWTAATGLQDIGGDVVGISADGTTAVGQGFGDFGGPAFRWTAASGFIDLGSLPGVSTGTDRRAWDVSADGSTVVGSYGSTAFMWDSTHGMRSIKDVLEAEGIDLTGWMLTAASGISDDGLTIVGYGINPNGFNEGWIAQLTPVSRSGWVKVSGVIDYNGIPVCAIVLANGQYMFSCDGNLGTFGLDVPLDASGEVTLFVFADGFAPVRLTGSPGAFQELNLKMSRPIRTRVLSVFPTAISSTEGRMTISGSIMYGDIPVCALILANGQRMFSCGENQGSFSLDVPLDSQGNVRLFAFASGFPPYKQDF